MRIPNVALPGLAGWLGCLGRGLFLALALLAAVGRGRGRALRAAKHSAIFHFAL